jgi:predicted dehydrogenase
MEKTKIAVIGLGGISQLTHLPILLKFKDVEITAVSEINKNRLNIVADKFNIKNRYQDYNKMLSEVDVDAVLITTPTNTHKQVAIDCLKAGRNIFIEKPVARKYVEAKAIQEAALNSNKIIMVGMNQRYRPEAMLLKSIIKNGEIGDLYFLKTAWSREQSSREKWMITKKESGGGVLLDLGIVLLDLAMWLFDYREVMSISAQQFFHFTEEVEDTAVAFIRCRDSSVIGIEVSWVPKPVSEQMVLSVYGSKGWAQLNPLKVYKRINDQYIDYSPSQQKDEKRIFKRSYENELRYFFGAVRGDYPFMSTIDEAVLRMSLIESIYKSAELKSEVKIEG